MGGGLAAACVDHRERSWPKIFRETELADEFALALAELGGLGSRRLAVHLVAIMLHETQTGRQNQRTRKLAPRKPCSDRASLPEPDQGLIPVPGGQGSETAVDH